MSARPFAGVRPGAHAPGRRPPPGPGPQDPHDRPTAARPLPAPLLSALPVLLALAADRATTPPLRAFATRLRSGQEAELGCLRPLLARMGLPDSDVHAGHDMPGMVTERDLAAARAAGGAAFDRLFLTRLRDHLRHSAQVPRSEITAGARADAKELAAALVTAREAALAEPAGLPGAARALG
ncbi:DUF305 domain-containing protein [Streptomyces bacillaris]|uniref:DUF305 domain-containing protein n=1 Tax=Streptomyces bacillaris TaxID=68179 RepID=UPI0034603421